MLGSSPKPLWYRISTQLTEDLRVYPYEILLALWTTPCMLYYCDSKAQNKIYRIFNINFLYLIFDSAWKTFILLEEFFAVVLLRSAGQILIDEDKFLSNVSFHFRHASLCVLSGCGRQNSPKSDLPRSCNTFCFIISACRSCWAVFDPWYRRWSSVYSEMRWRLRRFCFGEGGGGFV